MSDLLNSFLTDIFSDMNDDNVKEYDLTSKEGYDEFKTQLNKLKENKTFHNLLNIFDVDSNDFLNTIDDLADSIYKENEQNKDNKDNNSVKTIKKEKEETHFVRPSEKLDYDHQLQLHKIVQEYIDTMIKPFNNGTLTDEQINDAYAGLYEFAAWVMNK